MSSPERPVILTVEAREDYHDLTLYGLHIWGTSVAERYHADIARVLDSLGRFPRMGRRKEGLTDEIRTIAVGQHVIYYRIDPDAVRVLRILHSRMDATHHLDF